MDNLKKSTRRISAILFADIAGYTTLMQENESLASILLHRFQNTMHEKVHKFNGQIVNEMGDGMVCVFPSPLEATKCAMILKEEFQLEPQIPVRLGIHMGTVLQDGDKIYGNSLNIASRIESMSLPGAVLLSDQVRRDIKNTPEIKFSSLGRFHFKNVSEPLEVYAIANDGFIIPDRKKLKGKFASRKRNPGMLYLGGTLIVALLILVWRFIVPKITITNPANPTELPDRITKERIAVLPFENLTNNPELDNLGKIAANFINLGLMEIENAEVVSPATVTANINSFGILPGDPSDRPSFAELTGAKNVITGSYHLEQDRLSVSVEIQNTTDGKIEFVFPHFNNQLDEKDELISSLSERISGYWAAKEFMDHKKIKVPAYSAYNKYIELLDQWPFSSDDLQEILQIDSTFYLARIQFLNLSRWFQDDSKPGHFAFLARHRKNMTNYEKTWYHFVENLYDGKSIETFNTINQLRKRFPKDFDLNHDAAGIAYDELNNFILSQSIYDELPHSDLPENVSATYGSRIRNELVMKTVEGDLDELKAFIQTINIDNLGESRFFLYSLAAIFTQDETLYKRELEQELASKEDVEAKFTRIASNFSWDYRSDFSTDEMNAFLYKKANQLLQEYPDHQSLQKTIVAQILRVIDKEPVEIDLDLIQKDPEDPQAPGLRYLYWTALGLVQSGKPDLLTEVIESMESYIIRDRTIAILYGAALPLYDIGCVYAQMGKQELALRNLKESRDLGMYMGHFRFKYDKHLAVLEDLPAFQDLYKPIWPDGMDPESF